MVSKGVFECGYAAVSGAHLSAGSIHSLLAPVMEDFLKRLLPVADIIGAFVVLCQGDFSRYPVWKVPQCVIPGIAPLINAGIHTDLEGVPPLAGQIYHRLCARVHLLIPSFMG